ncbi:hypothetical protein GLU64_01665 [Nanohaloarchaea archaeon]|nr:hypothetical protein [Candidatus Nanohaloarchaea archaeon]
MGIETNGGDTWQYGDEEISGNGFQERIDFIRKFSRKLEERPDLIATEEDLKQIEK